MLAKPHGVVAHGLTYPALLDRAEPPEQLGGLLPGLFAGGMDGFLAVRAGFPLDVLIQGLLHGVEGFDIAQLPHDGRLAGEAHDQQGKGVAGEGTLPDFAGATIARGDNAERESKIGFYERFRQDRTESVDLPQYMRVVSLEISSHFRRQHSGQGTNGKKADVVGVFDNGGGLRYGILNHNYLCTGVRVVPLFGLDHQTAVFY